MPNSRGKDPFQLSLTCAGTEPVRCAVRARLSIPRGAVSFVISKEVFSPQTVPAPLLPTLRPRTSCPRSPSTRPFPSPESRRPRSPPVSKVTPQPSRSLCPASALPHASPPLLPSAFLTLAPAPKAELGTRSAAGQRALPAAALPRPFARPRGAAQPRTSSSRSPRLRGRLLSGDSAAGSRLPSPGSVPLENMVMAPRQRAARPAGRPACPPACLLRCTCFSSGTYSQVSAWLGRRQAPPFPCLQPVSSSERLCSEGSERANPAGIRLRGSDLLLRISGLVTVLSAGLGFSRDAGEAAPFPARPSNGSRSRAWLYFERGMRTRSFEVSFLQALRPKQPLFKNRRAAKRAGACAACEGEPACNTS